VATATLTPSITTTAYRPRPWLAVWTLCWRELVRFFRQRNRVVGAIGQPVLFWILFGAGLGQSFRMPGAGTTALSYREYYFPGTLALILLFTAIFATISIIEDRREGFLQSVLVAPIPRWSMVLGKVLGGTFIALIQAALFLVLAWTLDLQFGLIALLAVLGFSFVVALALTALGFAIAWRMDSTQGFHAIMSVFLMPMWLLSGAFFPAGDNWLGWVIRSNPLTYGVAGIRHLLYWQAPAEVQQAALGGLPSMAVCSLVTVVFAGAMLVLAWWLAAGRTTGDLL
jgi:ABC-2 type transport system permease protein